MPALNFLIYLLELLPCILCVIFIKKIKITKDFRAFFIYTITYSLLILFALFSKFYLENKLITGLIKRLAVIIEFILLLQYYSHIIININLKRSFVIFSLSFFSYSIYDYITSEEKIISFLPLAIECFVFISLIIYFFYEKLKFISNTPIYSTMYFWISTAFLIYFSGNFFLFLYSKTAVKNNDFKELYNMIYITFVIIKNITLSVGIFVFKENNSSKSSPLVPVDIETSLSMFKLNTDFTNPQTAK